MHPYVLHGCRWSILLQPTFTMWLPKWFVPPTFFINDKTNSRVGGAQVYHYKNRSALWRGIALISSISVAKNISCTTVYTALSMAMSVHPNHNWVHYISLPLNCLRGATTLLVGADATGCNLLVLNLLVLNLLVLNSLVLNSLVLNLLVLNLLVLNLLVLNLLVLNLLVLNLLVLNLLVLNLLVLNLLVLVIIFVAMKAE